MATAKKPRTKNIFPKMKRGGYTCQIRFQDEARGERFFDSEWNLHMGFIQKDSFILTYRMIGEYPKGEASGESIGKSIKAGDEIIIHPTKWTMRGRTDLPWVHVRVIGTSVDGNNFTYIKYEGV